MFFLFFLMNETLIEAAIPLTCITSTEAWAWWLPPLFVLLHATLPVFLFAAAVYAAFWKDIHTLYVLCAAFLSSMWAVTVKELTRIDRVRPLCEAITYGGHAMPSLTATLLGFLGCYYVVQFWMHARDVWSRPLLVTRSLAIILYCSLVCYSRVYLMFGRGEEILVGTILGGGSAVTFILLLKKRRLASYKSALKKE